MNLTPDQRVGRIEASLHRVDELIRRYKSKGRDGSPARHTLCLTADGVITDASVGAARMLGLSRNSLVGQMIFDLLAGHTRSLFEHGWDALVKRVRAADEEYRLVRASTLVHASGYEVPVRLLVERCPK
ncbi:MAG: PAS domain-containing protein, partial [Spirochaetia bacterium]